MGKSKTPSFTADIKIRTSKYDKWYLSDIMDIVEKLYNKGVKHYIPIVEELKNDAWFIYSYEKWKSLKEDDPERKIWASEISLCISAYKLNEFDVHAYFDGVRVNSLPGAVGCNIGQKAGTALHKSINKAIFQGTKIHYRKYGTTISFEDKKANSGIILKKDEWTVTIMGRKFNLKPIRKKDYWLQEAMTRRIKYCRVIRKATKSGYDYYVQAVLEGVSPKKHKRGNGTCGLDEGTSCIAYVNDDEAVFEVLADGVEKYDREIIKAAVKYERRMRMANPDCYNEDGTIKKGAKMKVRTHNAIKALFELKNAYRRRSAFIRDEHGRILNHLVEGCYEVVKEPMNFKALQKRSKSKATRQDKETVIKTKNNKIKSVRKFKRKKRYGRSISRRAPGKFNELLMQKATQYDISVVDVDIKKYRASQYDHTTGQYIKPDLSARGKKVGGHRVQRDLYSGYLLKNYKTIEEPDQNKCKKDFKKFLKQQGKVVNKVKKHGDTTGNFGLKTFFA